MIFSEILKDLLIENKLNAKQLAKKIKIQDSTLYKYLKSTLPRTQNAVKIANYFNCSINYLAGIDDNPNDTTFKNSFDLTLFYPRYNNLLLKHNTTHYEVSNLLNLNKSSLLAWKNGTVPYLDVLIKLAKHFSCSIDYLIGRSDKE